VAGNLHIDLACKTKLKNAYRDEKRTVQEQYDDDIKTALDARSLSRRNHVYATSASGVASSSGLKACFLIVNPLLIVGCIALIIAANAVVQYFLLRSITKDYERAKAFAERKLTDFTSRCEHDYIQPANRCISCCGNGIREPPKEEFDRRLNTADDVEECDDGNNVNNDGCNEVCILEYCGDGIVNQYPGIEECDDGTDSCCDCKRISAGETCGAQGDPHFKTWRGQHYDYHGECDLVLLHNSDFESGLGLDVHIRTKIRRDMSYITSAALRIGTDVLEVESQGVYYLNGVARADLPSTFGGFEFLHTQLSEKLHVFEVHLVGRERIKVKT
jgi:cysteine-rich repeat protein